jgi:hypothetical protein
MTATEIAGQFTWNPDLRVCMFVQRSDILITVSSESSYFLLIIMVKLFGIKLQKFASMYFIIYLPNPP